MQAANLALLCAGATSLFFFFFASDPSAKFFLSALATLCFSLWSFILLRRHAVALYTLHIISHHPDCSGLFLILFCGVQRASGSPLQ